MPELPTHPMWERGTCPRDHVLGPEDHAARRCLTCKRSVNAQGARARNQPVRFKYHEPMIVDETWQSRAICSGMEAPDAVFFPLRGGGRKARDVCQHCPPAVRRDCLASALLEDATSHQREGYGHRAGLSPVQRHQIRSGRRSFEESLSITAGPAVSVPLAATKAA